MSLLLPASSCVLVLVCLSSMAFAQSSTLTVDLGKGSSLELMLIHGGTFTQGSSPREAGREDDETQREVTITKDFYMAVTPVTRGQFARFVEETHYRTEAEKGPSGGYGVVDGKIQQGKGLTWRNPGFEQTNNDPVVMVTFEDALGFVRWFGSRAKRQAGLPTEAQWEYAVRAGSKSARYDEPVDKVAWHRSNSVGTTHPVGSKAANAWGIRDAYGPVWQWCRDWYAPYEPGSVTDPEQSDPGLSDKPRRVLRGGSFLSDATHSRSAERYRNDPRSRNADNGFRVICSATASPSSPPVRNEQPTVHRPHSITQSSAVKPKPAPSQASGMGWFGWLNGLLPFVIPIFIIFKVITAIARTIGGSGRPWGTGFSSGLGSRAGRPRFTSRLVADGFWIMGPPEANGLAVHYTYTVNGQEKHDCIVFTPGPEGHFVFTGDRPTMVALQTSDPSSSNWSSRSMGRGMVMNQIDHDISTSGSDSSSSSSFPQAY